MMMMGGTPGMTPTDMGSDFMILGSEMTADPNLMMSPIVIRGES